MIQCVRDLRSKLGVGKRAPQLDRSRFVKLLASKCPEVSQLSIERGGAKWPLNRFPTTLVTWYVNSWVMLGQASEMWATKQHFALQLQACGCRLSLQASGTAIPVSVFVSGSANWTLCGKCRSQCFYARDPFNEDQFQFDNCANQKHHVARDMLSIVVWCTLFVKLFTAKRSVKGASARAAHELYSNFVTMLNSMSVMSRVLSPAARPNPGFSPMKTGTRPWEVQNPHRKPLGIFDGSWAPETPTVTWWGWSWEV